MQTRDQLIRDHISHVKVIAKRIHRKLPSYVEYDDVYANGLVGLINAAERYKVRNSTSFQNYASYRIRGAILDGLRVEGFTPRNKRGSGFCDGISFNSPAFKNLTECADVNSAHADCLSRTTNDPLTILEAHSRYRLIAKRFQALSIKVQQILTAYYLDGRKLKDIASDYRVSESRVCQITTTHVNALLVELD
jgi:RNA polymerase sigma factor (sigma-70 family)